MKQGEPIEYKSFEGEDFPIYNSTVEPWLARTDMGFTLYEITEDNLEILKIKWEELVKCSFKENGDEGYILSLKKDFLKLSNQ